MDLKSLLLAYALSQGSHTAGHFKSAHDLNVPINLDIKNFSEPWYTNDKKKDAEIAGAGFSNQDFMRRALEGSNMQKDLSTTNALLKTAYLAGLPNILAGNLQYGGDVGVMEKMSGNKLTRPLLGASAAFDLWKAKNPDANFNLDFITPNGAPGLMGTWRW